MAPVLSGKVIIKPGVNQKMNSPRKFFLLSINKIVFCVVRLQKTLGSIKV